MPEPISMYGVTWQPPWTPLQIELLLFRCGPNITLPGGVEIRAESVGKAHHFKQVVKLLWGHRSKKWYQANPWNEKMLSAACKYDWLALSGCAASGKTDFLAIWGLVNWLCAPTKTAVICTSTSLSESRQRIWGRIEEYFSAASDKNGNSILPGKLISSRGRIKTVAPGIVASDRGGIFLVAGDRAKDIQNIGKLIGVHNDRVFFLCDEMPELSPALTEAAKTNLSVNPYFQFVASGNFKSIYDPFGVMATPRDGWGKVSPDMDEWPTKDGICLRFDGLKSPNILAGKELYNGIYSTKHLEDHRSGVGEHTAGFWRMCRSFPCQEADADRIYSDADFIKGDSMGTVHWQRTPDRIASLDPAFATGGDKAMACFALIGMSTTNKLTIQITELLELREDTRKTDESRPTQISKLYREACESRHVPPQNAAFDGSGGGIVFGSLLTELWSNKLLAVQFGGKASMRPASVKDKRPSQEAYCNRVAELWFSGLQFVQSGQIKGMVSAIASDLTERRYETTKGTSGLRIKVETKEEMKLRIKRSPDSGDAFVILLELARERMSFKAEGMTGAQAVQRNSYKQRAELSNKIYRDINYGPEEVAA